MSGIFINGWGAVSPAGWSIAALRDAAAKKEPLAFEELARPGREQPLKVLRVPAPDPRPAFLAHSRLRRTSPITQYAVAAALEALGTEKSEDASNVGVIVCVFSGCVNYSRRFYGETLKDPSTASPLVFPETVFNAPASHISAYLGSAARNYTLVGDAGTFLEGIAVGARWLQEGKVGRCLVVGTEELDWLTSEAVRLFDRSKTLSEGAGALLLSRERSQVELQMVTDEFLYAAGGKMAALEKMKSELGLAGATSLLCDSTSASGGISKEESGLWNYWTGPRFSPKRALGEGLMAAAAWQVVLAADAIGHGLANNAFISISGFHQHAIGARLAAVGGG